MEKESRNALYHIPQASYWSPVVSTFLASFQMHYKLNKPIIYYQVQGMKSTLKKILLHSMVLKCNA